jgi:hypothetical protein
MNLAQQISAAYNYNRQQVMPMAIGRPVDPTSIRQRVLAFLNDRVYETTREIYKSVGTAKNLNNFRSTIRDLHLEGKIRKVKSVNREAYWAIND